MDVLRAIHFADLHLGVEAGGRPNPQTGLNQRIHDVLDRLDELCECAEQEQVHLVLFAGDAFKHQHPSPTLQKLFAERVNRLAKSGAAVFLLVGNHDLPKMAALTHPFAIYPALEVQGVVVGDRAHVYRLPLKSGPAPEVQVAALPHFSRQELMARLPEGADVDKTIEDSIAATVERLAAQVDPGLPAVFAGHCHVNQAELSTSQHLFGVSELEVTLSSLVRGDAFPYYALGHVHGMQVLGRDPYVAYSGSLERVDFGEGETVRVSADRKVRRSGGEEKGFMRFDLTLEAGRWVLADVPSFRVVSARRFVTCRLALPASKNPTEDVLDRIGIAREAGLDPADAFVKIVVALDATDRARLHYRAIKDSLPEAYDVRVSAESPDESPAVRDPQFATRMGAAQALERYLSTRDDWADDRAELLRLGRALIEETDAA